MTAPLCIFVGSASAFNVRRLVDNLGAMLADARPLHLVATGPVDDGVRTYYDVFGTARADSRVGGARALHRYLRGHDPAAVVQVTRPPTHGSLVGGVCRHHGVRSVYRYSGDRFYEYRVASGYSRGTAFLLGNVVNRLAVRFCDRYVALGPNGKSRLVAHGVDERDVEILPPTIDPTPFERDREPPAPVRSDGPVGLFVGRLTRLKGARTLERTLPAVFDAREGFDLVVVGDRDRPLDLPERYASRVRYVGTVDPGAVPAYMQAADVLVHPSLTEGVPRVVLESLAAGTPVVARDVGDVASVTDNVFTGDREFVDLVARPEVLTLDDVEPFTRDALAPRYVSYFDRVA